MVLSLKSKENITFYYVYTLWIYLPTREQTLTHLKFRKDGIHELSFNINLHHLANLVLNVL